MQQHIPCSFIKQEKFTYIIVSMLVFLCNNKNSQNKHKTNLESILFHNLSQTRSLFSQKFALDPVLSLLSTISSNLLGFFAFWTVKQDHLRMNNSTGPNKHLTSIDRFRSMII